MTIQGYIYIYISPFVKASFAEQGTREQGDYRERASE